MRSCVSIGCWRVTVRIFRAGASRRLRVGTRRVLSFTESNRVVGQSMATVCPGGQGWLDTAPSQPTTLTVNSTVDGCPRDDGPDEGSHSRRSAADARDND